MMDGGNDASVKAPLCIVMVVLSNPGNILNQMDNPQHQNTKSVFV